MPRLKLEAQTQGKHAAVARNELRGPWMGLSKQVDRKANKCGCCCFKAYIFYFDI